MKIFKVGLSRFSSSTVMKERIHSNHVTVTDAMLTWLHHKPVQLTNLAENEWFFFYGDFSFRRKAAAAAHHTTHVTLCSFTHVPELVTQNTSRAVCALTLLISNTSLTGNVLIGLQPHLSTLKSRRLNTLMTWSTSLVDTRKHFLAESSCMSGRRLKGDAKFIHVQVSKTFSTDVATPRLDSYPFKGCFCCGDTDCQ